MDQLRCQGEGVVAGRDDARAVAKGRLAHSGGGEEPGGVRSGILSGPSVDVLEVEGGDGPAVVVVGIDVEEALVGP